MISALLFRLFYSLEVKNSSYSTACPSPLGKIKKYPIDLLFYREFRKNDRLLMNALI